jgi:glycosyltransferase involved in cell wall biosynthesis
MRGADALLVPLAAEPALDGFVPSKLFDCAAVGRPLVVPAAGECRRIAEQAGAAVFATPGDPKELAAAVTRLQQDDQLRECLGEAARRFGEANSRERRIDQLEALLLSVGG